MSFFVPIPALFRRTSRRFLAWDCASTTLLACFACNAPDSATNITRSRQDALALLLPQRIRIQPFTRISADGRELLVYVRAEDQFGDPVKVAGTFNVELYSYRRASADPKGRRIDLWQARIRNRADQIRYWDHTAQMYELRLQAHHLIDSAQDAYLQTGMAVLLLTYVTDWGDHLEDQYILALDRPRSETIEIAG